jgi:hypothetical protein
MSKRILFQCNLSYFKDRKIGFHTGTDSLLLETQQEDITPA